MAHISGNIVLYAKGAVFEYDAEDGTIHTVIIAHGMETRIIQNRHSFLQTSRAAAKMRQTLAEQDGEVVRLRKGKKRKH